MSVQIEVTDNAVHVASPYHPEFPKAAKAIGGRWTPEKIWAFDAQDEVRVRALCRRIYGEDGLANPQTTTIRYRVSYSTDNPFYYAGRKIAWRAGRDWPVRLGHDVIVVEGEFSNRSGSRANPGLVGRWDEDVILEIRNCPQELIDLEDGNIVEIVEEDEAPARSPFEAYVQAMAIVGDMRKGLDLVDEQIEELADCIIRLYPGKDEEL